MNLDSTTPAPDRKRGEIYEKIAFDFCKIATVLLILEVARLHYYSLPITAGASAILFVLAHLYGARQSRCVLRKPLLIAAFWLAVIVVWCVAYKFKVL